jgi:NADH:ubiquinone oxidoreductase subunit 5 (chain L)/Multisubunit Na+/H+ antiporter, MnhA subunit
MVVNHSINLLAEGKTSYTDGGVFAEFAWFIVVLPFIAALLITFFGKNLPLKGAYIFPPPPLFIFLYKKKGVDLNVRQGVASEFFINVGSIGSFQLEFGWVVDGLSIMMYFVVGTVSLLVFIYAINYMEGEKRYTFFFTSPDNICWKQDSSCIFTNTFTEINWKGKWREVCRI